jgi:hypothetical protein
MDPDKDTIAFGRQADPRLELLEGCFPQDFKSDQKYDMVTMFAVFAQQPDWKDMLLSLKKSAKKHVNVSLAVRLDGPTVIDIDTSYFYYLDSGERVHQVIQNLYELLNFCSTTEMEASTIKIIGYRTKGNQTDSFRPLAENKILKGNLLIEIEDGYYSEGRTGGMSSVDGLSLDGVPRKNVRPKIEVIIEGNTYHDYNEVDTFTFD